MESIKLVTKYAKSVTELVKSVTEYVNIEMSTAIVN